MTTKKQLERKDRNAQIKAYYEALPPGMRNMRLVAKVFGVSKSTVSYVVFGRKPARKTNKIEKEER